MLHIFMYPHEAISLKGVSYVYVIYMNHVRQHKSCFAFDVLSTKLEYIILFILGE